MLFKLFRIINECQVSLMKKLNFGFSAFYIVIFTFLSMNESFSQQIRCISKFEVQHNVYLEARFLLSLPDGYDTLDCSWPLLLFLHGKGESGEWIELVKKNGPPKMIEYGHKFPFIVVSPQCPEGQDWSVEVLNLLLEELVSRYRIDPDRIWVTGLSMGGKGTWELAYANPGKFAAIVPICGWTDPSKASLVKDMPIWVFHGAKDDIVPVSESEEMVNALKALGSPVRFTIYPEAGHDSWTETYDNPELWEWLEEQTLSRH